MGLFCQSGAAQGAYRVKGGFGGRYEYRFFLFRHRNDRKQLTLPHTDISQATKSPATGLTA